MVMAYYNYGVSSAGVIKSMTNDMSVYVSQGVTVGSTDNYCFTAAGAPISIDIDGAVYGELGGLQLGAGSDMLVRIGAAGSVSGNLTSAAAIEMSGFGGKVVNYGLLKGYHAIEATGSLSATIFNYGDMWIADTPIKLDASSSGTFSFLNTGTVTAEFSNFTIWESNGTTSEYIINNGRMNGAISLGDGVDRYDGQNAKLMNDGMLKYLIEAHQLSSFGSMNKIASFVDGGAGIDLLYGSRFSDYLAGGTGKDVLSGGGGNDMLMGGKGADQIWGGAGSDRFIFQSVAESSGKNIDRIMDFSQKQHDHIDLDLLDANSTVSGIDDFKFIGTKAFSGKPGELRYEFVNGDTHILGNIDKDKAAEFEIVLHGKVHLDINDFIF